MVGIAPTKTLAKVANHIAKKYKKEGVFVMKQSKTINEVLKHFPVDELWGVGAVCSISKGKRILYRL